MEWEDPAVTLSEKADLAAAYFQHLVVFQLRRAPEDSDETTEDLAYKQGVTAETLRASFGEQSDVLSIPVGCELLLGSVNLVTIEWHVQ